MTVNVQGKRKYDMIVLGASTGGPLAVREVLRGLPRDFPVGIAYVQHTEDSYYDKYAKWLNEQIELDVRLACDNDYPGPGQVLIAPQGCHLVFAKGKLALDYGPPVMSLRPCVDNLFISAAAQFKERLIGVLMTGMGSDGAMGCLEIRKNNGYTIAQDEATSVVFGMARVAILKNGISVVLPLDAISRYLIEITSEKQG